MWSEGAAARNGLVQVIVVHSDRVHLEWFAVMICNSGVQSWLALCLIHYHYVHVMFFSEF